MKKLLSIIGAISLITSGSSNLMACIKSNNDENGKGNKTKPKQEQPPEGSNWKLIDNSKENLSQEFHKPLNNKWYIMIYGGSHKIIAMTKRDQLGKLAVYDSGFYTKIVFGDVEYFNIQNIYIYRWDGLNKPNIPKIDNSGKIIDWNGINIIT